MIAIPAVDLREGACVQLVGGEYAAERVRLDDPVAIAAAWQDLGFDALHVVDLDAATGRGDNAAVVRDIISVVRIPVQVGGGVRDEAAIERLLAMGAARVVVGTRALEEPDWLDGAAARFGGHVVVAADVRDRDVLTRGWSRTLDEPLPELLARLSALPLAGVLVTAVHQEGRLAGPDLPLTR
jgi:phosphoribosylformimino-5-aminoimidazole carboxamide ribotide isomerase